MLRIREFRFHARSENEPRRSDRNEPAQRRGYLGAVFGRDICGAFAAKLSGAPQPVQTATAVALFPKELERDPNSPYLQSPHVIHDVPEDDPALTKAYLRLLAAVHPAEANNIARLAARRLPAGADYPCRLIG
jgi:hypothetical protein